MNGKVYIGKTGKNPPTLRWRQHVNDARSRRTYLFHRAIAKHGEENFRFEVIGEFDSDADALRAEVDEIAKHQANDRAKGYNLTLGGEGTHGYKWPRDRIKRGRDHPLYGRRVSERERERLREMNWRRRGLPNPWKGHRHSEASRALMRKHHHDKQRHLSASQVEKARRMYSTGRYDQAEVARLFGVSVWVMRAALRGTQSYGSAGATPRRRSSGRLDVHRQLPVGLSSDQVSTLRRRYRDGESYEELSRSIGMSTYPIQCAIRGLPPYDRTRCNEPPIPVPETRGALPLDRVDEVRRLYATGQYSYPQLGKRFGVTGTVIYNAVRGRGAYGRVGSPRRTTPHRAKRRTPRKK